MTDASPPFRPIVIIPARLASTRLPGKPLADIAGVPMIVHVWRRAVAAAIGPVVVACAEPEIADAVRARRRPGGADRPDHPVGLGPHLRGGQRRSIQSGGTMSSSTCRATCR